MTKNDQAVDLPGFYSIKCGSWARIRWRGWPIICATLPSGAAKGRGREELMPWRPRVHGGDIRERDGRIAASTASDGEGPLSAITKWIPIEVIACYQGVTTPFGNKIAHILLYAMTTGVVITFLWTGFATEDAKAANRVAWRQVFLAVIAFIFWVLGTTSPDILRVLFPWWIPAANPAALALGALVLPIADNIMRHLRIPQD
jgi:hypothetical protein